LRSIFVEGLGEVRYVLLTQADISEIAKSTQRILMKEICKHFSAA
jgi:hypothetical protein